MRVAALLKRARLLPGGDNLDVVVQPVHLAAFGILLHHVERQPAGESFRVWLECKRAAVDAHLQGALIGRRACQMLQRCVELNDCPETRIIYWI